MPRNQSREVFKNFGTPNHIGFVFKDEEDDRRHKTWCKNYDSETGKCKTTASRYYTRRCGGSSHCDAYDPLEEHSSFKPMRTTIKEDTIVEQEDDKVNFDTISRTLKAEFAQETTDIISSLNDVERKLSVLLNEVAQKVAVRIQAGDTNGAKSVLNDYDPFIAKISATREEIRKAIDQIS